MRRRRRHDAAGPDGGTLRVRVPPWKQPALHGATTRHRVAHPTADLPDVPAQRLSLRTTTMPPLVRWATLLPEAGQQALAQLLLVLYV